MAKRSVAFSLGQLQMLAHQTQPTMLKTDKPNSLNITVEPSVLSFSAVGDKKTFIVNVKGKHITQVPIVSGSISWIDGMHMVRTPLVVYTVLPSAFANSPSHHITNSAPKKISVNSNVV